MRASVGGVVEMAVLGLGEEEIVEVVRGLVRYLVGRGALESEVSVLCCELSCRAGLGT